MVVLSKPTESHLPQGRCGLKFTINPMDATQLESPSARKVWIEILDIDKCKRKEEVTFRKEGVD